MTDTVPTIQCELMLLRWTEDSNNGGILRMQVDDLEPFKAMTEAKGKRAGQRFMAVLVPLNDDETPERQPAGPLCKLAAIWCREPGFQDWLARTWPTLWGEAGEDSESPEADAKRVVCRVCDITSRKELDTNGAAKRTFNELIRRPYSEHLTTL